jgi:hypothetical protein
MTNYNDWDRRAARLAEEADEEDRRAEGDSNAACGLQDGPQGPPTQLARERRGEMAEHSQLRRNFIAEQQAREVALEHHGLADPVVISAEQCGGRALRLQGSSDVVYDVPKDVPLLKLFVDRCCNVKVHMWGKLTTATVEISHCSDVLVHARIPVATVQCDECAEGPVQVLFSEPEQMGTFYHQNSPALEVAVDGQKFTKIGTATARQFVTKPHPEPGEFVTEQLIREGEGEWPVNLNPCPRAPLAARGEPEAEASPLDEQRRSTAEAKREEGNSAFKASDFLQAAVFYTEAIELCPSLHLAWANRAQCMLQTGQPEKALADAVRCTELAPEYAKGWFRKGMALHALKRFGEAIPALVKAEEADPKNSQVPEAIKMAQLMCRRHGPGAPQ